VTGIAGLVALAVLASGCTSKTAGVAQAPAANDEAPAQPDDTLDARFVGLSFVAGRAYTCEFRVRATPERAVTPAVYQVLGGV